MSHAKTQALKNRINRIKQKRIDLRSLALTKKGSREYLKKEINHKKLPKLETQKRDDNEYRKLSISEWEKKYLDK